jgi:hypothetical protein
MQRITEKMMNIGMRIFQIFNASPPPAYTSLLPSSSEC